MRKQADPKCPMMTEPPNNVVSLGTESMVAIAEELRKMYATYLREKPPERIERLMRQIERGEDISGEDDLLGTATGRLADTLSGRPRAPKFARSANSRASGHGRAPWCRAGRER